MKDFVRVLDSTVIAENGVDVSYLLDGNGRILTTSDPGDAVWLTFTQADIGTAANSRGEVFQPNIEMRHFEDEESHE